MLKRFKVSIIIPVFNDGEYIGKAINSALGQTYKNTEVIVVDDGSTNNIREILRGYNDKVKYIYQYNRGPAAARNTGLAAAKGSYIQFLDADDLMLPEKIELQLETFESLPQEYAVVYSDFRFFNENDPKVLIDRDWYYFSGHIIDKLIWDDFIPIHSALVKRSCFEKVGVFNESLLSREDYELWVRIACAEYKFYYLDKVLALYRKRAKSVTTDYKKDYKYMFESYKVIYNKLIHNRKLRIKLQIAKFFAYLDYSLIKVGYFRHGVFACSLSDIIFLWNKPVLLFKKLSGRLFRFFHNLHRIS